MIGYRIYNEVYENIIKGLKKVEFRLLNEKSKQIKIGDEIKFTVFDDLSKDLIVKVTQLHYFNNLDDLWDQNHFIILDNIKNKDEFKKMFYNIFGKEEVEKHKIIGIEFVLIERV